MKSKTRSTDRMFETTPRDRLAALPPERQAQLLDPAEAEFAAQGFAGASLNRILEQAGMSKGQAYYYISDKLDLYRATIDRAFRRLASQMDFTFGTPAGPEEFWGRMKALFTRITEIMLADERLAALACGIYESAETRGVLAATDASIRSTAADLVTLGQKLGAVRDDMPHSLLFDLLFGMALEMDRWLAAHWHELDESEALRLNMAMFAMLRAAASPVKE
ncbi:MAG: TetR/AcrR family transcriptional regulator [Novosphingobium sp.]